MPDSALHGYIRSVLSGRGSVFAVRGQFDHDHLDYCFKLRGYDAYVVEDEPKSKNRT